MILLEKRFVLPLQMFISIRKYNDQVTNMSIPTWYRSIIAANIQYTIESEVK